MFNISEFNASVNRTGGLAQRSQYLAVISPPPQLNMTGIGVSSYHLGLRVDSFEFPSRSIVPIEYRDYGPVRPIGGQANFTETTCSVILSSDLREREFFMRWQDIIVGNHRDDVPGGGLTNDEIGNQFDVGYFDDYKSAIVEVRQYNQTSRNIFDYTYSVGLKEVFPSSIGALETSWDGGNEIHRMNVTFSYRNFVEDFRLRSGSLADQAKDFFFAGTRQRFEDAILRDIEPGVRRTLTFIEGINEDIGL